MLFRRSFVHLAVAGAALVAAGRKPALAQQRTVRIATEGAYAPRHFTGPGGQILGFETDLANDLCRPMNAR